MIGYQKSTLINYHEATPSAKTLWIISLWYIQFVFWYLKTIIANSIMNSWMKVCVHGCNRCNSYAKTLLIIPRIRWHMWRLPEGNDTAAFPSSGVFPRTDITALITWGIVFSKIAEKVMKYWQNKFDEFVRLHLSFHTSECNLRTCKTGSSSWHILLIDHGQAFDKVKLCWMPGIMGLCHTWLHYMCSEGHVSITRLSHMKIQAHRTDTAFFTVYYLVTWE